MMGFFNRLRKFVAEKRMTWKHGKKHIVVVLRHGDATVMSGYERLEREATSQISKAAELIRRVIGDTPVRLYATSTDMRGGATWDTAVDLAKLLEIEEQPGGARHKLLDGTLQTNLSWLELGLQVTVVVTRDYDVHWFLEQFSGVELPERIGCVPYIAVIRRMQVTHDLYFEKLTSLS